MVITEGTISNSLRTPTTSSISDLAAATQGGCVIVALRTSTESGGGGKIRRTGREGCAGYSDCL